MKSASAGSQEQTIVYADLSIEECEAMLAANHVGRIAYSHHDDVDIRPIHYVASDKWLFGRTSEGDKLMALRHHKWVAFEVDEIEGPLDWKSVIVRGAFYELADKGSVYDCQLYARAVKALRRQSRAALTTRDPFAFRSVVFGISIDSMSGKSCSSRN
jgi:uncharacterized protein